MPKDIFFLLLQKIIILVALGGIIYAWKNHILKDPKEWANKEKLYKLGILILFIAACLAFIGGLLYDYGIEWLDQLAIVMIITGVSIGWISGLMITLIKAFDKKDQFSEDERKKARSMLVLQSILMFIFLYCVYQVMRYVFKI